MRSYIEFCFCYLPLSLKREWRHKASSHGQPLISGLINVLVVQRDEFPIVDGDDRC